MEEHEKQIIKHLDHFRNSRSHSRREVILDAVEYVALYIATKYDTNKKKERLARLNDIGSGYKGSDAIEFYRLMTDMILPLKGMRDDFGDHFGEIYTELSGDSKAVGFTPYHVLKKKAAIALGEKPVEDKVFILNAPACGSGGIVVAAADVWTEQGFNYICNALVVANDIDRYNVLMSYLQISFTGMPAVIKHQDTLTQKTWDRFITPAFALQYPKFKRIYNGLSNQPEM